MFQRSLEQALCMQLFHCEWWPRVILGLLLWMCLFCFVLLSYLVYVFFYVWCCLMFIYILHIQMQLMQRLDQWNVWVCVCVCAHARPPPLSLSLSPYIHVDISVLFIVIIINIKDWTLWSIPSPELQLLLPTFVWSSNCSPSLWSVVIWFQRDSI
jgi:hypothetical protein